MTNNYFRVGDARVYVFFNDDEEVEAAFSTAQAVVEKTGGKIVMYQPCKRHGPWNDVELVGHRKRSDIVADIDLAVRSVSWLSHEQRVSELKALDDRRAK